MANTGKTQPTELSFFTPKIRVFCNNCDTVHKMCIVLIHYVLLFCFLGKGGNSQQYSFIILKTEAEYDIVNHWRFND